MTHMEKNCGEKKLAQKNDDFAIIDIKIIYDQKNLEMKKTNKC